MLIALLLIPAAIGLSVSLFAVLLNLGKNVSQQSVPFWAGMGSYFLFQLMFFKPVRTYVFGHELTHALAGLLSGARLKKFKVSASGGSVELSKTNIFITLAPYFIPIYTVILIAVYWAVGRFRPLENYHSLFLFLAGFTLAFHFGLTHFALMQGQSDLKHFGVFFSSVMIILVNCVVLAALFKVFFPSEVGLKKYFAEGWVKTCDVTAFGISSGKQICIYFRSMK